MSKNLSKDEANIVSTQEKIKEQASEIDQEIDKCYVEQLQELNKHHEQLKERLHNAVARKNTSLEKQLKDMKSMQDELVNMKELREHLEKTSDYKIMSTKKEGIESRMQKVSEQYKHLNTKPVESDTMMFDPFKQPSTRLGQLYIDTNNYSEIHYLPKYCFLNKSTEFCILAKDRKGCNCTKGGSQVSVQLTSFTGDVTAGEVRDNNDGSYMASFVAEQIRDKVIGIH